jgi:fatty acid-binding protein DegV
VRPTEAGVDITADEFCEVQAKAKEIPTTSQSLPGDFTHLYRKLAKKNPDILSIHSYILRTEWHSQRRKNRRRHGENLTVMKGYRLHDVMI